MDAWCDPAGSQSGLIRHYGRLSPAAAPLPLNLDLINMKNITYSQTSINLDAATQIAQAAITHARSLGIAVNVAVLDANGILSAFLRCENTQLQSLDLAMDKAHTAVSFGIETLAWQTRMADWSDAARESLDRRPRFTAIGGGLPILDGRECIGAIGVSGGTAAQDIECAQIGIRAVLG